MKAIYEFEKPISCHDCQLGYDTDLTRMCSAKCLDVNIYQADRAPFCPLKIKKEG